MRDRRTLTQILTDKIDAKQQFLIQFSQYDGGQDTFYPIYSDVHDITFQKGDIIAWFWGEKLKFGVISNVFSQSCLLAIIITRETTGTNSKANLAREQIVSRFAPV